MDPRDLKAQETGDLYNCACPRDPNGKRVCAHLDFTFSLPNPDQPEPEIEPPDPDFWNTPDPDPKK